MKTQTRAFWTSMLGVTFYVAACVGDDPISGVRDPGNLDASTNNGSSGAGSSSGGTSSSGGASSGGTSSGAPSGGDGGDDAAVPRAAWGNDYPAASKLQADTRMGRRLVAFSETDQVTRLEWFDSAGVKGPTAALASSAAMTVTGLRLDDAGDAYVSVEHTGDLVVGTTSVVAADPSKRQCTVMRIAQATGASVWARSLHVAAANKVSCSVRRVLGNAVLLVAGHLGTLTTTPASFNLSPNGSYDGLVAIVSASDGGITWKSSLRGVPIGGVRDRSEIMLRDAHFLSPSRIAVVGNTSSPRVATDANRFHDWSPIEALGWQAAGLVVRFDMTNPTSTEAEIWPVTIGSEDLYEGVMTLQAVVGSGADLVVTGSCYASTSPSRVLFTGLDPMMLHSSAAFAVGISASSRRLVQHVGKAGFTETFMSASQSVDGHVSLVGTSAVGLSLGGSCDRSPRPGGFYKALFDGPGLGACIDVREFDGAAPVEQAGTGDSFMLSMKTSAPVQLSEYLAPANRAVVVDLPH